MLSGFKLISYTLFFWYSELEKASLILINVMVIAFSINKSMTLLILALTKLGAI